MEKYLKVKSLLKKNYINVLERVNSLELTPVYMGSAFKNKGVQPLLNAVARYLPSPVSCANLRQKRNKDGEEKTNLNQI